MTLLDHFCLFVIFQAFLLSFSSLMRNESGRRQLSSTSRAMVAQSSLQRARRAFAFFFSLKNRAYLLPLLPRLCVTQQPVLSFKSRRAPAERRAAKSNRRNPFAHARSKSAARLRDPRRTSGTAGGTLQCLSALGESLGNVYSQ